MKRAIPFRNIVAGVIATAAFFGYTAMLYKTLEYGDEAEQHAMTAPGKVSPGNAHAATAPDHRRTTM